jgi:hypothetical protein
LGLCDPAKLLEVMIVFVEINWKHMKPFFSIYVENIRGFKDGL